MTLIPGLHKWVPWQSDLRCKTLSQGKEGVGVGWDGSAGDELFSASENACCRAWRPESDIWNPHDKRTNSYKLSSNLYIYTVDMQFDSLNK